MHIAFSKHLFSLGYLKKINTCKNFKNYQSERIDAQEMSCLRLVRSSTCKK